MCMSTSHLYPVLRVRAEINKLSCRSESSFLFSKRNCQRWNALRGGGGASEVIEGRGGGGVAASALWSISTILLVDRTGNCLL